MKLHRGICRTVLLAGRWAFKIPTTRPYGQRRDRLWAFGRGLSANHSEKQWSGTPGVAPVLWSLGGWLNVYPRCEPICDNEVPAQDHPWWDTVAPTLPFADRKTANLGRMGEQVVWVDYDSSWNGCPHQPWNEDD